ncbi:MAG: response regulator, partial [Candidatus Zixiibacteriota bacterium]
YEVMVEYNGEKALDRVGQFSFDWIITDYRLPGMDGLEVLRQTKRVQPKAQIIVISAYGTPQVVQEAERRGASHFLAKPFSIEELIKIIHGQASNPNNIKAKSQNLLKRTL